MRLAHRYVLRSVLTTCFGGVLVFGFVILVATVFRDMLNMLLEGRLTPAIGFKLILAIIPWVFVYAVPFGMLTGILLAMGRLSAEREIQALRSSGMSIMHICSPIIVLAIVSVAIALVVNFELGPRGKSEYRRELAGAVQQNPLGFIVEKTFVKDFPEYIIYVGEKDGEKLTDFWVWQVDDEGRAKQFIRAETGFFDYEESTNELMLRLVNTTVEVRDERDPENFQQMLGQMRFAETTVPLSLERILGKTTFNRKLSWMTFSELRAERARLQAVVDAGGGPDLAAAKVALMQASMAFHKNFASAFSVLSLSLLAIPFGIVTKRKETSANIFFAIGLGFVYLLLEMVVGWLVELPQIRPDLLFWAPNFMFQAFGLWLLMRSDRGRKPKSVALAKVAG